MPIILKIADERFLFEPRDPFFFQPRLLFGLEGFLDIFTNVRQRFHVSALRFLDVLREKNVFLQRRVLYFSYQPARWILREGLTGSVRPDRAWVAQNLKQAELGVEARAEAGLATPRWACPSGWRAEVAALRPDAVAAEVPYRWGAAAAR